MGWNEVKSTSITHERTLNGRVMLRAHHQGVESGGWNFGFYYLFILSVFSNAKEEIPR